jgi:hypothetical protein
VKSLGGNNYFLIVIACAVFYTALSPMVAWPLYSSILFHPDRHLRDITLKSQELELKFGAKREDIQFRSKDGNILQGYFFRLPHSSRVFLVSHGNGGNISRKINLAATLLDCGGSV